MAYKVIIGKDKVNYESWFRMCEGLNDRRETRYLGGLYNVERLEKTRDKAEFLVCQGGQ